MAALDNSSPSWTLSGHRVKLRRVGFSRMSAAWSSTRIENATGEGSMMRQGMARVLVVEYAYAVRNALHHLLIGAAFEILEHPTHSAAFYLPPTSPDATARIGS